MNDSVTNQDILPVLFYPCPCTRSLSLSLSLLISEARETKRQAFGVGD